MELADSLDSGSSVHYARAGSSPASRTIEKVLKRNGFEAFSFYLSGFCCSSLSRFLTLFLTQSEKAFSHRFGEFLFSCVVQMTINVCGHLNICMPQIFLNVFQGVSAIYQQTGTAVTKFMKTDMWEIMFSEQQ